MIDIRSRLVVLTTVFLSSGLTILAQGPPPPPASVHLVADGGTQQTLESIFIPPLANAPFSLTLETEWTRR